MIHSACAFSVNESVHDICKSKMSNRVIFAVLIGICVSLCEIKAYANEDEYEDGDRINLLDIVQNYAINYKENRREVDDFENWTGRWMPDRSQDPIPPPKVISQKHEISGSNDETHMSHTVSMGFNISDCDDGQTNLTVDWDNSLVNYTCYGQKIVPSYEIEPLVYCEKIPKAYKAAHICMHKKINYVDDIPLYGSHRPVWPVYGEYKFMPPQRWLHSLEHGAVVMLYHPCANPYEVKILKTLVKNCLRRYIITPYNLLDEDRPLALLTWGCRLTMSYVNPAVVRKFIKKKALHGPEPVSADGGFSEGLLQKSAIVTDLDDTILCPNA